MKVKIWIIMLLLFISTFIMQTICNINLGNTNQRILKKSFSVPIDAFFWNQALIDDNENTWNPPESVKIGLSQFINLCNPPIFATTLSLGLKCR